MKTLEADIQLGEVLTRVAEIVIENTSLLGQPLFEIGTLAAAVRDAANAVPFDDDEVDRWCEQMWPYLGLPEDASRIETISTYVAALILNQHYSGRVRWYRRATYVSLN